MLGLELKRYYNSQSSHPGLLGANWRMSYETVLYDFGSQIQIVQADGRRLMFQRGIGQNAALCSSAQPQDGQVRIEAPKDAKSQPTYHWRWADGRTLMFTGGSGGGYPLQSITAATGERLTLSYSPAGELTTIRDPQGRRLDLIYAAAAEKRSRALKAIDTPLGRLSYTQDARGRLTEVAQARDATGAPFVTRLYHYEDRYNAGHAHALTGISVRGVDAQTRQSVEQRLSTYAYNAAGQAVLSTRGRPLALNDGQPRTGTDAGTATGIDSDTGIEQVQVEYLEKALPRDAKLDRVSGEAVPTQLGKAILMNSLGQKTEITSAVIGGHFRLIEMRGAGCSTCGPVNRRYAYDAHGLLRRATQLDAQGKPVKSEITEVDGYGRVARVGVQVMEAGRAGKVDKAGKAQPVRWLQRFEYPDVRYADGSIAVAPQPSLIARPSVVEGKEHTIALAYNELGQVTSVMEAGFSPVDDQGSPSPQGAPISRTTRYSYRSADGRSLLAEIDGPLPNGPTATPDDSDIVRLEWDARGQQVIGFTSPMNLKSTVEFDERTGAPLKVTGPSGVTDVYRYGPHGEVLAVTHSRGAQALGGTVYSYDLHGRLVETSNLIEGKPVPTTLQAFDIADRLLWQSDKLGVLRRATYDTESHLLRSQVLSGSVRQEERYAYDALGRLERVDDSTGVMRRLLRGDDGRITASIDPLGRVTQYLPQPGGRALHVTQAANTAKPLAVRYGLDAAGRLDEVSAKASNGAGAERVVTTRLLQDDFGREVSAISPDSGTTFKRYDTADRLVQVRDATGNVTEMAYDLAGRMIKRSVRPALVASASSARPAQGQTTHYVYEGNRLVELRNPQQTERYAYDEHARLVSKTVRLTLNDGQTSTSDERYRYDTRGRLIARSLPDGSELQYERNGQGQVVAVSRQTGAWAPFGWGRTTLVSNLERDLIGLKRATYGNGVVGQWQRSREGVLARVVYTGPVRTPSALRTAFENLIAQAQAQAQAQAAATAAPAGTPAAGAKSAALPGAFGLDRSPRALWDSRLLFDAVGNVVVQGQFADTAVARPAQTRYAYDGLDQLAQAVRAGEAAHDDLRSVADQAGEAVTPDAVWRYHSDSLGNRLLAQQQQPAQEMSRTLRMRYAEPPSDRLAEVPMDDAGRPLAHGEQQLVWDADGRLSEVSEPGKPTVRYHYDARGLRVRKQVGPDSAHYLYDERRQRLAELDAEGRVTREYVWLGDQLLAVIDVAAPRATASAPSSVLGRIGHFVGATWRAWTGGADALAYVHVNHLGAPVAMTNANAKPVWSNEYAPFGQRLSVASAPAPLKVNVKSTAVADTARAGIQTVRLDLRLPGQWEDEETGLYYNNQRYYDPRSGRYLSPDPSGLQGGLNAYAYVQHNPLGFTDPLGLVLFAFDGTNNTDDTDWLDDKGSSLSNVWQFRQLYQSGNRRYITGVGTVYRDEQYGDIRNPWYKGGAPADAGLNLTGSERIDRMVQYFKDESDSVEDNTAMKVDIVGFSRGAAEARDFSDQIVSHTQNGYYRYTVSRNGIEETKCQKVDFRFMGLWDTVLSTNWGRGYNLGIPGQFGYVAQAVALNEFRGDLSHARLSSIGAFPLESIMQPDLQTVGPVSGKTGIERGFIGSHSDIGGGEPDGQNQLAQVALTWMVKQADLAGVKMLAPPSNIVGNPVIHDRSDSILTGEPATDAEDRAVRYRGGSPTTQRRMTFEEGMSFADTHEYIKYLPINDPRRRDSVTGTIDTAGYLNWLNKNGYGINMTVQ